MDYSVTDSGCGCQKGFKIVLVHGVENVEATTFMILSNKREVS